MKYNVIGALLLIVGTSIGGGMLALPIITAAAGFWHALLLLVGAWFFMTVGAFFVLEASFYLPAGANLISMTRATLGKTAALIMWAAYLLLLYSLLSAYLSGGSGLLSTLFSLIHLSFSSPVNTLIFLVLLGAIVAFGIRVVDWSNRALLLTKLFLFIMLLLLLCFHVKAPRFSSGGFAALSVAIMPVITSYGFAIIMPSLRTYLKSNLAQLRIVIAVGSLIPLLCYVLWDFVVQGVLPLHGGHGLSALLHSTNPVGGLTYSLSWVARTPWISWSVHIFTALCVATSFLGVSLSLTDFLSDGLRVKKEGWGKGFILLLSFLPPLILVIFYPAVFIKALSYAGIACVIVLMLFPALMVLSGRYIKKWQVAYRLVGGGVPVFLTIAVSLVVIIFAVCQLLHF